MVKQFSNQQFAQTLGLQVIRQFIAKQKLRGDLRLLQAGQNLCRRLLFKMHAAQADQVVRPQTEDVRRPPEPPLVEQFSNQQFAQTLDFQSSGEDLQVIRQFIPKLLGKLGPSLPRLRRYP